MKRPCGHLLAPIAVVSFALLIVSFSACSREKQAIIIQLTNAPSTITINDTARLTANVGHDTSNAGVDWSCSGGACGTFVPTHTANGASTVYTAPATPGTVTITVAAAADPSVHASIDISVVPIGSNAMLNGTYVFSVQGVNGAGNYSAVGTILADGNGHITGGEQDYADESLHAGPDALTGTYAIGPDGRGSITLDANNTSLPQGGIETFGIAITSATHALIIEFDGTANSSGHLDAQAASAVDPAAISGPFAFTTQGEDVENGAPITHGGVLTMSAASGTVTSGTYYQNDGGFTFSAAMTGSVTAPDTFGRGTLTLSIGLNFVYYAVQGQVLRLVETDVATLMTAGSMFGQGAAGVNGTFSNASLAGGYVLSHAGGSTFGPLVLAGQFAADGAGNFATGVADVDNAGVTTFASIAGLARYSIAGNGVGTLTLPPAVDRQGNVSALLIFAVSPSLNLLDPNSASGGGGALVMDNDGGAVASGYIVPQTAGVFDGNYAVNVQFVGTIGETDWVGQSAASAGTLTGTVDVNEAGLTSAGLSLTGSFTADPANTGRWTGTFTVNGITHQIKYYQVSGTLLVIMDADTDDVGIGILEKE